MSDDRLLRLENQMSKLQPKVQEHHATITHINGDISGIKNNTKDIFEGLNGIKHCVDTMPQKVGEAISTCRKDLERDVKDHIKETYLKREHALMPKHLIMAGVIISAVMGFVTYINNQADRSGGGVSELVQQLQSGAITINKHEHSEPENN